MSGRGRLFPAPDVLTQNACGRSRRLHGMGEAASVRAQPWMHPRTEEICCIGYR